MSLCLALELYQKTNLQIANFHNLSIHKYDDDIQLFLLDAPLTAPLVVFRFLLAVKRSSLDRSNDKIGNVKFQNGLLDQTPFAFYLDVLVVLLVSVLESRCPHYYPLVSSLIFLGDLQMGALMMFYCLNLY